MTKNTKNEKKLFDVLRNNDIEEVKKLLADDIIDASYLVDDQSLETLLMSASALGFLEIVRFLIEDKAVDVNFKSSEGWTALMFAYNSNNVEVAEFLLTSNAIIQIEEYDKYPDLLSNIKIKDKIQKLSNYPHRMSVYLSEEDYQQLKYLSTEVYQGSLVSTLRALLHKTLKAELKQ